MQLCEPSPSFPSAVPDHNHFGFYTKATLCTGSWFFTTFFSFISYPAAVRCISFQLTDSEVSFVVASTVFNWGDMIDDFLGRQFSPKFVFNLASCSMASCITTLAPDTCLPPAYS